mmetsp:Transcript_20377/g.70350  ORF Transcript_20377/g.70350 Transcript_20377/m.70350 type:complete len:133 (+) Transcript_20377:17-415(+)
MLLHFTRPSRSAPHAAAPLPTIHGGALPRPSAASASAQPADDGTAAGVVRRVGLKGGSGGEAVEADEPVSPWVGAGPSSPAPSRSEVGRAGGSGVRRFGGLNPRKVAVSAERLTQRGTRPAPTRRAARARVK